MIGGTTVCSLKSRETSQSVFVLIFQQDFQCAQEQMSRLSTFWKEEISWRWISHGRVFHRHLAHEVEVKRRTELVSKWNCLRKQAVGLCCRVLQRLISSGGYQVQYLLIFAKLALQNQAPLNLILILSALPLYIKVDGQLAYLVTNEIALLLKGQIHNSAAISMATRLHFQKWQN